MYLELASIHLFVASCHCFATYTIFRSLFDGTNTTSTTPVPAVGSYDGIEDIMPLSRVKLERDLLNTPAFAPARERHRVPSSAKPRASKGQGHRDHLMSSNFSPYQHLAWFDASNVEQRKVETTTRSTDKYHFKLAWFDESKDETKIPQEISRTNNNQPDTYLPAYDYTQIVPEILDETLKSLNKNRVRLHFIPELDASTAAPKTMDETTRSADEVSTNIGVSVSDLWHWMLDDPTTTSLANKITTTPAPTVVTHTTNNTTPSPVHSTLSNSLCPEQDSPSNIGPYEVPTERDLVRLTKTLLVTMFDSYHQRTFQFLRDIKEASKAAISEDKNCVGDVRRIVYRQCLKEVSGHYEQHIKKLVNELESDRHEIKGMTEGSVCSLGEMKKDPVDLIKTLALEEVSLQFAFPGFLRLISSCRRFCDLKIQKKLTPEDMEAMKRKQDLEKEAMLKYMLTQPEYLKSENKFQKRTRNKVKIPKNIK